MSQGFSQLDEVTDERRGVMQESFALALLHSTPSPSSWKLAPQVKQTRPSTDCGCTDRASHRPFQKLPTRSHFQSWMCPLLRRTGSPPSFPSELRFPGSAHNLYSLVPGTNSLSYHRAALVPHKSPEWHIPAIILLWACKALLSYCKMGTRQNLLWRSGIHSTLLEDP